MEQQRKELTAAASASSPAASASSGSSSSTSPSVHGSTSMASAFLGISSSSTQSSHSQTGRSSASLYPPPRPVPVPDSGNLASRDLAATATSVGFSASRSSPSSSQLFLHKISPSPGALAKRRPRPHGRLTPFLSELSSIRRTGASAFGDLNVQEMTTTQRPLMLHGQQQQEMTRLSSSSSLSAMPHHRSGELSGADMGTIKRGLHNNQDDAARLKEQKENHLRDLEDRVDTLKTECSSLSAQVESQQEMMANLKAMICEMEIKLEELEEQDMLSQDLNNQLRSEIERLKKT